MVETDEDAKSLATSTTLSVSVSSSMTERTLSTTETDTAGERKGADSHEKDLYFIPEPAKDSTIPLNEAERTLSPIASSKLENPPPSVHLARSEKHFESTQQSVEEDTQRQHSLPGGITVEPSWSRRFCLHWLTAYRLLIALAIFINVLILALSIQLNLDTGGALTATAGNLLVSVLVRQEDLINFTFGLVARIPSTLPRSFRKIIADFHHYGGVHIGTAVSALMWYIAFVAANTQQYIHKYNVGSMTAFHWADIATSYAFMLALLLICFTALPRIRERFHNAFERTHRFAGWTALLVLWVNSGIYTRTTSTAPPLYTSPALWLLAATTFLIVLPWLRIRKVPITATQLSHREVLLRFPYANMPHMTTVRFSSSPATEWHAFATIPSTRPEHADTASVIVSMAGDWTKSLVAHPPSALWIRRPATSNFLCFAPLFKSVLLVATGAGIGPVLSLLTSPAMKAMRAEGRDVRVLWCAHAPYAPHWAFAVDAIRSVDAQPMIWDSLERRPDLSWEAKYLAALYDLEAVMVVSHRKVTDEIVRSVKASGRAAYGAVFDS